MIRHGPRWGIGAAFLAALICSASAQEPKQPPPKGNPPPAPPQEPAPANDDYRQFFKKPQTALEFWKALQFELEVGRPDLAAALLHGLVASKPPDEALVELADREGMAAILRLRNVRQWVRAPRPDRKESEAEIARLEKAHAELDRIARVREELKRAEKEYSAAVAYNQRADDDAEALIASITAAVKKVRGDPKRIAGLIGLLTASPEEGAFALRELYKSGAAAVPQLIEALRTASGGDRSALLDALRRLGTDAVPPMLAALGSDDAQLKIDLLDILGQRVSREAVPDLWFLSASPAQPELVRRKATALLAAFLDTPASRLPLARAALTREAERYYRHEVLFPDPRAVTIWRWDNGRIVAGWPGAPAVPATAAEEYYGVHYADQALTLDPAYRPAQVVLLSLLLDKGSERAGLAESLTKGQPQIHALLATSSPQVIDAVLERALDERRTPVVLNSVRTLGGLADPQANRPSAKGEPVLVRALYYPDRRVQMAAAEAILRGPNGVAPSSASRVLEVFRRALAAEAGAGGVPKVLVAYYNPDKAGRVANAVRQAGFEPVTVHGGRDVLRRLGQAADIDLLLIESTLPDPGLAGLLGQLKADTHASRLPIVLTAVDDRQGALQRFTARDDRVFVAPDAIVQSPKDLQRLLLSRMADPGGPLPLNPAELQDYSERAIRHLNGLAHGNPPGVDVRPAADAILEALRAGKLSPEGQLAAVAAAGTLSGARTQNELSAVVLNGQRPLPVRLSATRALVHHIQQHTALLTRAQAVALENLFAQADTDPALKAELALLLGSLKPDTRLTGERLLRYRPTPPGGAGPPTLVPAKDKDEKEPGKD
jgi:CheY-like chemotaxis protein